jgi:hypothetical protein
MPPIRPLRSRIGLSEPPDDRASLGHGADGSTPEPGVRWGNRALFQPGDGGSGHRFGLGDVDLR